MPHSASRCPCGIRGVERAKVTSPRVTYVMPSIFPDAIRPTPTCLIFTIIVIRLISTIFTHSQHTYSFTLPIPYPSSPQVLPKYMKAFWTWLHLGQTLATPWVDLGYTLGRTWVDLGYILGVSSFVAESTKQMILFSFTLYDSLLHIKSVTSMLIVSVFMLMFHCVKGSIVASIVCIFPLTVIFASHSISF